MRPKITNRPATNGPKIQPTTKNGHLMAFVRIRLHLFSCRCSEIRNLSDAFFHMRCIHSIDGLFCTEGNEGCIRIESVKWKLMTSFCLVATKEISRSDSQMLSYHSDPEIRNRDSNGNRKRIITISVIANIADYFLPLSTKLVGGLLIRTRVPYDNFGCLDTFGQSFR